MRSHKLEVSSTKQAIRPGRGIAAGRGKTAGRGTKGQSSRSGGKVKPGFEGGQNPFSQRLPKKRGFKSHRVPPTEITTGQLNDAGAKVDNHTLVEKGFIENPYHDVKIILKGELKKKVTVAVALASKGAVAEIEKAGGTFTATASPNREKTTKK